MVMIEVPGACNRFAVAGQKKARNASAFFVGKHKVGETD
jgi:hypothetical protein